MAVTTDRGSTWNIVSVEGGWAGGRFAEIGGSLHDYRGSWGGG